MEVDDVQDSYFDYGSDCKYDTQDSNIKCWIPRFSESKKPSIGRLYPTLTHAEEAYREYASIVGFDVRSSTTHTFARPNAVSVKYYRCTREGFKNEANSIGKRNTTSDRCGCNARISLKFAGGNSYVVSQFIE